MAITYTKIRVIKKGYYEIDGIGIFKKSEMLNFVSDSQLNWPRKLRGGWAKIDDVFIHHEELQKYYDKKIMLEKLNLILN